MPAVIYGYLVVAYGVLVQGGKWALSPDDTPKNLKVVPESYREKVAEWLVEHPAG
jgi:lipoprotein